MKKFSAALVLSSVLFPIAAIASTPSPPSSFAFNGLYGGLDLGFSSLNSHMETGGVSADQGSTNVGYGGFVGYGAQVQNGWYLGGELGLGDTDGSVILNDSSTYAKESQNYAFSADLRAGKIVGQSTLAYAKLGWAHSEFDQIVSSNAASTSDNTSYDGVRFGAGAETLLSNNLTGRLEAIYTDYGSQVINNVKFAPSDVGVRFGVAYYFQ